MDVADIIAQYDENGVDLYFLHSKRVGKELKVGPLLSLWELRS